MLGRIIEWLKAMKGRHSRLVVGIASSAFAGLLFYQTWAPQITASGTARYWIEVSQLNYSVDITNASSMDVKAEIESCVVQGLKRPNDIIETAIVNDGPDLSKKDWIEPGNQTTLACTDHLPSIDKIEDIGAVTINTKYKGKYVPWWSYARSFYFRAVKNDEGRVELKQDPGNIPPAP